MKIEFNREEMADFMSEWKSLSDEMVRVRVECDELRKQLSTVGNNHPVYSRQILITWAEAFRHAAQGEKIAAIKIIRAITGCGLKEAKEVVEGSLY